MSTPGLDVWFYVFSSATIVAGTVIAAFYWAHLGDGGVEDPLDRLLLFPILVLVLPFMVFYYYLLAHREAEGASGAVEARRRLAGIATIAGLFAVLAGGVVAPPDPFSVSHYIAVAFPVGAVLGFLLTR